MITKIKIAMLRKVRDTYYWTAKVMDNAALDAAVKMADAQKAEKTKEIDLYRKMYVFYTKLAVNSRNIVGKCNMRIIRSKSA